MLASGCDDFLFVFSNLLFCQLKNLFCWGRFPEKKILRPELILGIVAMVIWELNFNYILHLFQEN